ncbi:hypothetical protein FB451DRAFT_1520157 [Mycena latifolia]|nr:hypothetical protein FB451DRAFT_1520157 [Mycena latifolia]
MSATALKRRRKANLAPRNGIGVVCYCAEECHDGGSGRNRKEGRSSAGWTWRRCALRKSNVDHRAHAGSPKPAPRTWQALQRKTLGDQAGGKSPTGRHGKTAWLPGVPVRGELAKISLDTRSTCVAFATLGGYGFLYEELEASWSHRSRTDPALNLYGLVYALGTQGTEISELKISEPAIIQRSRAGCCPPEPFIRLLRRSAHSTGSDNCVLHRPGWHE